MSAHTLWNLSPFLDHGHRKTRTFSAGLSPASFYFPRPSDEPDVQVSRIRLSDKTQRLLDGAAVSQRKR
jgi:hypothetical protein